MYVGYVLGSLSFNVLILLTCITFKLLIILISKYYSYFSRIYCTTVGFDRQDGYAKWTEK